MMRPSARIDIDYTCLDESLTRLDLLRDEFSGKPVSRSPLVGLPAELRTRIYAFVCKDIYIDRLGRKAAETTMSSNQTILNIVLTCKMFYTELPPVISNAVTVSIRTRDMLALERQLDRIPMTLRLIPPFFSKAKNVVGHWIFFPNQWLTNIGTPSIPMDVVKYGSFGWKRVRMVATVRLHDQIYMPPPSPDAALTRFWQTIERGIKEHIDLKDYLAVVPGIDLTVDINVWSERLQSYVGKFLVTAGVIDMKMWRVAVPDDTHVLRVLHDVLGLERAQNRVA